MVKEGSEAKTVAFMEVVIVCRRKKSKAHSCGGRWAVEVR